MTKKERKAKIKKTKYGYQIRLFNPSIILISEIEKLLKLVGMKIEKDKKRKPKVWTDSMRQEAYYQKSRWKGEILG